MATKRLKTAHDMFYFVEDVMTMLLQEQKLQGHRQSE